MFSGVTTPGSMAATHSRRFVSPRLSAARASSPTPGSHRGAPREVPARQTSGWSEARQAGRNPHPRRDGNSQQPAHQQHAHAVGGTEVAREQRGPEVGIALAQHEEIQLGVERNSRSRVEAARWMRSTRPAIEMASMGTPRMQYTSLEKSSWTMAAPNHFPLLFGIMSGQEKCPVGKAERDRGGARRLNFVPALNVAQGNWGAPVLRHSGAQLGKKAC